MPPRLNITPVCRTLAFRAKPLNQLPQISIAARAQARCLSDQTDGTIPQQSAGQLNPLSLPAFGETKPDNTVNQQVEQEVPDIHQDPNAAALHYLQLVAYGVDPRDPAIEGHKFGLPELPLPSEKHVKHRYDPIIDQMTRLLMKDGKLGKAQRDMAMILNYLRTQPPPRLNPARPLVPGHPAPSHFPLNPVQYFTIAIESIAPLAGLYRFAGLAGGGKAMEVPVPLHARKRRRIAFNWILDTVKNKPSKGSGRAMFAHRVAEEIVAVVEGRSSVWDKRQQAHKAATASRANLGDYRVQAFGFV
ncbi:Ribosomal protein S7 domain containing protein [Rhypophila sp. PSN 637]